MCTHLPAGHFSQPHSCGPAHQCARAPSPGDKAGQTPGSRGQQRCINPTTFMGFLHQLCGAAGRREPGAWSRCHVALRLWTSRLTQRPGGPDSPCYRANAGQGPRSLPGSTSSAHVAHPSTSGVWGPGCPMLPCVCLGCSLAVPEAPGLPQPQPRHGPAQFPCICGAGAPLESGAESQLRPRLKPCSSWRLSCLGHGR